MGQSYLLGGGGNQSTEQLSLVFWECVLEQKNKPTVKTRDESFRVVFIARIKRDKNGHQGLIHVPCGKSRGVKEDVERTKCILNIDDFEVVSDPESHKRFDAEDINRMGIVVHQLDDRRMNILLMRYGAFGRTESTVVEISTKLGISRQRVHQIFNDSISIIRQLIIEHPDGGFVGTGVKPTKISRRKPNHQGTRTGISKPE